MLKIQTNHNYQPTSSPYTSFCFFGIHIILLSSLLSLNRSSSYTFDRSILLDSDRSITVSPATISLRLLSFTVWSILLTVPSVFMVKIPTRQRACRPADNWAPYTSSRRCWCTHRHRVGTLVKNNFCLAWLPAALHCTQSMGPLDSLRRYLLIFYSIVLLPRDSEDRIRLV